MATLQSKHAASSRVLGQRELELAGLVWRRSPTSRSELHQLTGLHANLIGTSVQKLVSVGLLREDAAPSTGAGRPRVPLTINDHGPSVLGISLVPGEVRLQRLSLRGRALMQNELVVSTKRNTLIPRAASLLADAIDSSVIAVGISVTGFVDLEQRLLLFSSAVQSKSITSLQPIYDAAGSLPLFLDNDMHALSVRWLVNHGDGKEDTLLVGLDDGRMGASMLVSGKPNRGCVNAANEMGHMRLNVDTDPCFCGQIGCLERIFSTPQLQRLGEQRPLGALLGDLSLPSPAMDIILGHLATGLANVVNFMRPTRLVLASLFAGSPQFITTLEKLIRDRLLPGLVNRVRIEPWEQSFAQSAEVAGWLALAHFFGSSWKATEAPRA